MRSGEGQREAKCLYLACPVPFGTHLRLNFLLIRRNPGRPVYTFNSLRSSLRTCVLLISFSSFSRLHVSRVQVVRMHGDMQSTLRVQFTCKDDTAVAGLDYVMTEVSAKGGGDDLGNLAHKGIQVLGQAADVISRRFR